MPIAAEPVEQQEAASATLAMVGSALAFSLMAVGVKRVSGRIPVAEVMLARAVVSLALSWVLVRRAGVDPWGKRRGLLLLRGVIGSIALFCVYAALALLPLAVATLLQYLYPSFTALLAWLLLGERIGARLLPALGLGWLGVMLTIRPPALPPGTTPVLIGMALSPDGVLYALGGALLTALAYVCVRSLRHSDHPLVIVFWFPLVAIPFSLPLVLLEPVLPTPQELLWLVAVGVFTQLGQIGLTAGLTGLPAARATTISYVQVAFAGLWGWWLFGEAIGAWTVLGALLILAAALLALGQGAPPQAGVPKAEGGAVG